MALPIDQRVILIVGITIVIIIVVIVARVLTGRPWSNISPKKKQNPSDKSPKNTQANGPDSIIGIAVCPK